MKRQDGITRVNDDEWYTPRDTADKVAEWLSSHLAPDTPILCPADVLPDGSESEIPKAMRAAGFLNVRVTRDLPIITQDEQDWVKGEVIVTNPPFSLLVPFRKWYKKSGANFCVLSSPASLRNCWSIPELKDRFKSTDGRNVAAAWHQNIFDTSSSDESAAIGNCNVCERVGACPNNSMTGGLTPGDDRPLYGWGHAVRLGLVGNSCRGHVFGGRNTFARFFKV